jgi:hypothetical protein
MNSGSCHHFHISATDILDILILIVNYFTFIVRILIYYFTNLIKQKSTRIRVIHACLIDFG